MNAEGVRMLTTAVVLRAILDYRRAWRCEDRRALRKLERFFCSAWFDAINPVQAMSGEEMMRWIREKFDPKVIRTTWKETMRNED